MKVFRLVMEVIWHNDINLQAILTPRCKVLWFENLEIVEEGTHDTTMFLIDNILVEYEEKVRFITDNAEKPMWVRVTGELFIRGAPEGFYEITEKEALNKNVEVRSHMTACLIPSIVEFMTRDQVRRASEPPQGGGQLVHG